VLLVARRRKYLGRLGKAMGNVPTCSGSGPQGEAVANSKDTKAYQWWGLHVLSAKCKDKDNGVIYFDKEINIFGIVVLALVMLIVLWIIMKMMHQKPDVIGGLQ
jgi:hypothetical protein